MSRAWERLVVIGGDAAGLSAAAQARRLRPAGALEIVVLEEGPEISYSTCGIPYWIGGLVEDRDRLLARTPSDFAAQDIAVRPGTRAEGIDLGAGVKRAVVLGGGYIGLEMAEVLQARGLEVTVVLGTATTKVGDLEVARTGLCTTQAEDGGFDYATEVIESSTRAGYYPGAAPITVKILTERGSGLLLGAQIVGGPGIGKRIDVFATAIWAGLTAEQLAESDLSYAPPFSPTYDLVLVASRVEQG